VAIANSRLVAMHGDRVSFRWKDYRHASKKKTMTLDATEFLRRFLLHVLPKGFTRIRHYGYLANRCRRAKLDLCRRLLGICPPDTMTEPTAAATSSCDEILPCPSCRAGRMRFVALVQTQLALATYAPPAQDSS
jgi:hypothetical protein